MPPLKLVVRNLLRRPLRSILTMLSIAVAVFLICALRTLVTTINAGVEHADSRRLAVMSSTGLFVELPLHYQEQLRRVPGVELTTKFQWFGGYYINQSNFFAQFAIDPDTMFDMYPECQVPAEQVEAFRNTRTGCVIGDRLAQEFHWSVGDTVPIIGALHPHPDDRAWEFQVVGIYHSDVPSFDNRTLFLRWDYFEETLKMGDQPPGVGVYSLRVAPGTDIPRVIADVEDAFRDSEQRVDCVTEAEFQRQFVTMFGNIPLFVGWIGTGVVLAILLASINTMLMSMREQTLDVGILKSLGFTDGAMFRLLVAQGLTLCVAGGALGILLARAMQPGIANAMAQMFPGFVITPETFALAASVAVVIGLIAGGVPAFTARRLRCVEALRAGV